MSNSPDFHTRDATVKNQTPMVDIVVPVHNGGVVVRRCLDSVLACRPLTPFELVVVDDASTDAETIDYLDRLAADGKIRLLRNTINQGFVGSANRGLRQHADRDVVLLNSDTEVANDWLDRLTACAHSASDIGTVTPFSNNATICSFPVLCADNPLPAAVSTEALDRLFAEINKGRTVDLPTAVGFCMYVRRACVEQIGLLDEERFGRGYGEENDFCRRALRAGWRSVLATDVFVFHAGSASFGGERAERAQAAEAILQVLHPDYLDDVRAFIRNDPPAALRRAVEIELARQRRKSGTPTAAEAPLPADAATVSCKRPFADADDRPVQLHVIHDLAGGVERWCRDYCRADSRRRNLILKPFCRGHAAGEGLMLFAAIDDPEPVALWIFASPFEVTAASHGEYAAVVRQIIADYGVQAILVSSLIGHTLDVLTTGLPTAFIGHDYFPACPAINLYFDGVCQSCPDKRLIACAKDNPDFNPFLLYPAEERLQVRQRFLDIVGSGAVTVVVPCRTVWDHLLRLFPVLADASWVAIPHGIDGRLTPIGGETAVAGEKLRIVVLGMLSVNKGLRLLSDALQRLTEFAEVHLVGSLEVGELFLEHPGVHVVPRYKLDQLQAVVAKIGPHAGMLLSIWPETYSYTLTELMQMGIPTVATRVGSFAERIIDGETGFLVDATADALIARLKTLNENRDDLRRIRANLACLPWRTAVEMVDDYHRLLPPAPAPQPPSARALAAADATDALGIRQAVALSTLWKQVKSLDLQLVMSKEARPRWQGPGQIADSQRRIAERQRDQAEHQRAVAEHQRTIAEHNRAIAEHNRAIAEQQRVVAEQQRALADVQFENERQRWLERTAQANAVTRDRDRQIAVRDNQIRLLHEHVSAANDRVTAMYASTSWRIAAPLRAVSILNRRLRLAIRCVVPLFGKPSTLSKNLTTLYKAWRSGGLFELRAVMLAMRAEVDYQDAWRIYHQNFAQEVRPRIVEAVQKIAKRPLISVIVPTYNTPKAMLRQTIESVRNQLYPDWQLCIADDCSTEPHVAKLLQEYADEDSRIKVHLGSENHGVSYASNRALEMAGGEFIVLLDHDDVLEEQALFRVAQAILSENPDMVYSDEILLSRNLATVLQYSHRPAFSLELLRSHPYIVHMVGFRASLLRAIGGFDENLAISQDYDLILRASEQARTIVHIPEILYQWRIHSTSSGRQKVHDVMGTSRQILERHLQRSGETGLVEDGARFNLFAARYPLAAGMRVAIIIPTKNHSKLVRQCVDSLRATIRETAYDIVIIDHESDDAETIDYLASLTPEVQVLRYVGPFNFSAINNWAVGHLAGHYSHYLFCNNDIEALQPGWLERMLELGQQPDVGIVGAELLYPDRATIQHAGVCVGAFGIAEHFGKFLRLQDTLRCPTFSEILASNHEVSAVTAACMLIRREAFEAVSGFDEAMAVGFGDVDLCLRVGQLGYRVLYCPHAVLIHHESFTRGKTEGGDPHPEDSAFFRERWQPFLAAGDPYFNPCLWQNSTVWQIRQPMLCQYEARRRVYHRDEKDGRQRFASAL